MTLEQWHNNDRKGKINTRTCVKNKKTGNQARDLAKKSASLQTDDFAQRYALVVVYATTCYYWIGLDCNLVAKLRGVFD